MISQGSQRHHLRFEELAPRRGSELRPPAGIRPSRETLTALHELQPGRALAALAGTWGCIALALAAALVTRHWLVWIAAAVVIGRCQHALAVLMHDAAHHRLLRDRRWNDLVGQWLCARPIFSHLGRYRTVHLRHHKHLLTQRDPDLSLSLPYPVSRASWRRKLARDLVGVSALVMRGYLQVDRVSGRNRPRLPAWRRLVVPGAVLLGLLALWPLGALAYALLWIAPIFTVYQVILRVRGILEHAAVPDKDDPLRSARSIVTRNPLARFFLNPHHVAYHLEHHLYPGVPHYHLPALQRALQATGAYGDAHVVQGYGEALRALVFPSPGV